MLQIDELTHVYDNGVKALDDVTLAIPTGMFGLWVQTARANRA
jgi:ABC-2 type transport system ATP-binding protein